jgi:ribulose-phosphate 3-epimerase
MGVIISPSILGGTFSNMEKIISDLDKSKAEYIHFDVMDGDFVPNLTFGPKFIYELRNFSKKIFDVHLMINRVETFLDEYINAGSDIVTFHCEVNEDLKKIITKIKKSGIKCGLAIKPKTSWTEIKPYLNFVDQITIMTVEPGFGGQEFMNDQVVKIKHISDYIKANDLNVNIEIDGGINYETGKICVDAGANILVAGSFIFNQGDLITATNKLSDNFN